MLLNQQVRKGGMSPDLSCNLKLAILTDLKRLDAAADVIRTDVLREENKSRNLRISREVFSVLGDAVKSARDVVLRDTFFRVSNFYCKIFLSFWHVIVPSRQFLPAGSMGFGKARRRQGFSDRKLNIKSVSCSYYWI